MTDDEARSRQQARDLCDAVLDDPRFRVVLREVVLAVCVELGLADRRRAAEVLVKRCGRIGVRLYLNAAGRLVAWPRRQLTPELEAAVDESKHDITLYLANGHTNGRK